MAPQVFQESYKEDVEDGYYKYKPISKQDQCHFTREFGYDKRNYKSIGFCSKCVLPIWGMKYYGGHEPRNCRNPPFCAYHERIGHAPTPKCHAYCSYCGTHGHNMRSCRRIKECVLCEKKGHNPLNCFIHSNTMATYMARTKELNRCVNCLTLFTTDTNNCTHCGTKRIYWVQWTEDRELQTEINVTTDQESQTELQQVETIINDLKLQTEEFKNQIAVLEGRLENSISIIDSLDWKLQATIQERDKALHRAKTLNSVCHARDLELIDAKSIMEELQNEIRQKDLELKQHKEILNAQPPFPKLASNKLENTSELQIIKTSLEDLQAQQQQIAMIVNNLFYENRIKTLDTTNYLNSYPSFNFNPYMALWDTGQNFNKLQQV